MYSAKRPATIVTRSGYQILLPGYEDTMKNTRSPLAQFFRSSLRTFLSCSLGAVFFLLLLPCCPVSAEETGALIEHISFAKEGNNRESVSFKLNGQHIPEMSALEGNGAPKLVFDFLNTRHSPAIKGKINSQGNLINAIRTGMHSNPQKTRVVVDLAAANGAGYDFSHEFLTKDNILKIIIFQTREKNEKKTPLKSEQAHKTQTGVKNKINEPVPPPKASPSEAIKKEVASVNAGERGQEDESLPPPSSATSHPPEPQAPPVSSPAQTEIHTISFEHSPEMGDTIRMQVSNFHPPVIFGEEGPQPSIICDFQDAALDNSIKELLPLQGEYISQIRVKKDMPAHKARIILELIPNRSYDLKQVFYKEDGLFVLYIKAADTIKKKDS